MNPVASKGTAPAWLSDPSKLPKRPPGAAPVTLPPPAPPDAPRARVAAQVLERRPETAENRPTDRPTDRPTEQAARHCGLYALCWQRKAVHVARGIEAGRSHPMRLTEAQSWLESEQRRCDDFSFWLEGVTR